MLRICPSCKKMLDITNFYKVKYYKSGFSSWCIECTKLYGIKKREERRLKVLHHYSNGEIKCKLCGYSNVRALVIDHINNDGAIHKRALKKKLRYEAGSSDIYKDLIDRNMPIGFQVLCCNCNTIKQFGRN